MAENLETLMENVDIAKHIMQYLPYDDHMSISRVCKQFEDIIINFIWKFKYRHVQVIKKPWIYLVSNHLTPSNDRTVMDQMRENFEFFKSDDFDLFLKLNAPNIEHLQIGCKFSFREDDNYLECHLYDKFQNLTTLSIYGVILADYDIKIISCNSPALNTLAIVDCVNARKQVLVVGHDVRVVTIANMEQLKCFTLKNNCIFKADLHIHNFLHIRDILCNLKLEELHLNVAIYSDKDGGGLACSDFRTSYDFLCDEDLVDECDNNSPTPSPCKELEIGQFHNNEQFSKFTQYFLSKYENLTKLTICGYTFSSSVTINTAFFDIVSRTCVSLTYLKLSHCIIKDFAALPPMLDTLILEVCKGLNCMHLKIILNEMNLKTFTTLRTKYIGNLQIFALSPSLQYLELDFEDREFVELFEQIVPNLITLHWRNACNQTIKHISHYMPNLETFITHNSVHDPMTHELLNLKSLHTLSLHENDNIWEVLKLIQHPTLRQLTLGNYKDIVGEVMPSLLDDERLVKYMRTNLSSLVVPLKLFKALQDFWFDLLTTNVELMLVISTDDCGELDDEFMFNLINSKKFPVKIKSIKFSGLCIDCADLKNYFSVIMKKIEIFKTTMLTTQREKATIVFNR